MRRNDLEYRDSIVKEGGLYDGYDAGMESIHLQNADRLQQIIQQVGWPGISLVDEEGANAAFLIAQHSISNPSLQRSFLDSLAEAVAAGEAKKLHHACLQDRILFNEGKPQRYGMLFDWSDDGEFTALVDDIDKANQRRKEIGLNTTIQEAAAAHRKEVEKEGGPPKDIPHHRKLANDWAIKVGWKSADD